MNPVSPKLETQDENNKQKKSTEILNQQNKNKVQQNRKEWTKNVNAIE